MSATPAFDEIETFLICGQRERSLCGRAGGWVGGWRGRREGGRGLFSDVLIVAVADHH